MIELIVVIAVVFGALVYIFRHFQGKSGSSCGHCGKSELSSDKTCRSEGKNV